MTFAPDVADRNPGKWSRVFAMTGAATAITLVGIAAAPVASADNRRLNASVVANVYTMQHQRGCTNDVKVEPHLVQAAEWHAKDVLNNRALSGDLGSDGSTPQSRADSAGYRGVASQTVAINPALSITGIEILNQWFGDPVAYAIMANCTNTQG